MSRAHRRLTERLDALALFIVGVSGPLILLALIGFVAAWLMLEGWT